MKLIFLSAEDPLPPHPESLASLKAAYETAKVMAAGPIMVRKKKGSEETQLIAKVKVSIPKTKKERKKREKNKAQASKQIRSNGLHLHAFRTQRRGEEKAEKKKLS